MTDVVIDTSAFVAIFKKEPVAASLVDFLAEITAAIVPATCLVELALLRRIDENLAPWARELISRPPFRLVELTIPEANGAMEAAMRFGKGSGHPAQLNFGDCLAYAAAKQRDLPLLFTGNDFLHTDIRPAL